jgi:hypothetical protein
MVSLHAESQIGEKFNLTIRKNRDSTEKTKLN